MNGILNHNVLHRELSAVVILFYLAYTALDTWALASVKGRQVVGGYHFGHLLLMNACLWYVFCWFVVLIYINQASM